MRCADIVAQRPVCVVVVVAAAAARLTAIRVGIGTHHHAWPTAATPISAQSSIARCITVAGGHCQLLFRLTQGAAPAYPSAHDQVCWTSGCIPVMFIRAQRLSRHALSLRSQMREFRLGVVQLLEDLEQTFVDGLRRALVELVNEFRGPDGQLADGAFEARYAIG